jgi:hypothetical protein
MGVFVLAFPYIPYYILLIGTEATQEHTMTDAERLALLEATIRNLPAILIKGGQMPGSLRDKK